jgi:hypothetical protein
VYKFSSEASVDGTLTLNANGDPDAQWVFQIGSTLLFKYNSNVVFLNGIGTHTHTHYTLLIHYALLIHY